MRIAREYAGMEQDELAELIGVSRNTIGNAEKGRVQPRPITINAWALACGVPRSWLKDGTEPHSGPDDGGTVTSQPTDKVVPLRPPAKILEFSLAG